MLTALLLLSAFAACCGAGLAYASSRADLADGEQILAAKLDDILPQLQCAKCGYPGCRPYADAVARGEAEVNLCPPGGPETALRLAETMNIPLAAPPQPESAMVAFIRESECVGCALCLPACPVDAIVGAEGSAHVILESECVGCELCLPPCPVDCIEMRPPRPPDVGGGASAGRKRKKPPSRISFSLSGKSSPCIRCGLCVPACPVDLSPLRLHQLAQDNRDDDLRDAEVLRCVECAKCDDTCPSEIPLAEQFAEAKTRIKLQSRAQTRAADLREKHFRHQRTTLEKTTPRPASESEKSAALNRALGRTEI